MKQWKYCMIFMIACLCAGCNQEEELVALNDKEIVEESKVESEDVPDSKLALVYVHICGSVKNPGVYAVNTTDRVVDVVNAAGGLLDDADVTGVNLAKELTDGMQIIIPSSAESEQVDSSNEGKINLNTASQSELCTLPNIGASRAIEIITYREENGDFKSIDEIMKVSGIKEGIYADLKDFIYVP